MALGGADILKLIVEADVKGAVSEFGKLEKAASSSLSGAEKQATGFSGKLKSSFSSIGSSVSSAITSLGPAGIAGVAATAGGALAAFAKSSISAFQDTALAAGKFHDATGLSVEDSSKWIAVADDIGVSAETLQSAFVKLEKGVGSNGQAFAQYGVEIAKAKDGSVDLNATLLNAVDAIQKIDDPTRKAAASAAIFGKGYAEVGELINTSSADIVDSLNSVSDAQVIDPSELAKARDFRAAMDNLSDSVGDVQRSVGEDLVPALTDAANGFAMAITKASEFGVKLSVIPGVSNGDVFKAALGPFAVLGDLFGKNKQKVDDYSASNASLAAQLAATSGQTTKAQLALQNAADSQGTLAEQTARAASQFGTFEQRAAGIGHAMDEQAAATSKAEAALRSHTNAVLEATGSALGVSAAQREFNQAVADADKVLKDSKASTDDKAAALDRETSAALDAATATVNYAEKQAQAQGKTLGAKEANDILIGTLYTLASKANPQVQAALGATIAKLQETGAQHPNPTVSVNDQASGKISSVQSALRSIQGSYNSTINVGVNTGSANAALDALRGRLNAAAGQGVLINGRSNLHLTFARGGLVPGGPNQAVPALVHGGEYVLPSGVVDAIRKGQPPGPSAMPGGVSTGGSGVVIQLNGTFLGTRREVGRWVDEALAEARRAGNRAA